MAKIIPIFFYLALALVLCFAGYLAFIGARNILPGIGVSILLFVLAIYFWVVPSMMKMP